MCVLNFLNEYNGALMVGITAIYVIATIFICVFNGKSAKATRKQVTESQWQFEENQRLQTMPFLQLEISNNNDFNLELDLFVGEGTKVVYNAGVVIKNVGLGAATNIIYTWAVKERDISDSDVFPINAIRQGDTYDLLALFNGDEEDDIPSKAVLTMEYMDMLGQPYEQKFIFDFGESKESGLSSTLVIKTDSPRYLGVVRYKANRKGEQNGK